MNVCTPAGCIAQPQNNDVMPDAVLRAFHVFSY